MVGRTVVSFSVGLLILFLSVELNRARIAGSAYKKNSLSRLRGGKRGGISSAPEPPIPAQITQESHTSAPAEFQSWLEIESSPPARLPARLHDDVVLECVAVGSPPPLLIWLKNGKPMEAVPFFSQLNEVHGVGPSSGFSMAKLVSKLPLRCIRPEEEAEYSCVATQPDGRKVVASTLVVIEEDDLSEEWKPECEFRLPPFAYSKKGRRGTPAYVSLAETFHMDTIGGDLVITCRGGGIPKPKITWTTTEDLPLVIGKKFQINTKGDLVIRNLSWNEMGEYKCTVENAFGSDSSSTFLYPLLPEER